MDVLAWVFLGAVGVGVTYVSFTTDNDDLAILSGALGTLTWLLFAFFALDITVYDANGTVRTARYPAMVAFGLAWTAPNLYVMLTGPLQIVQDREQLRSEVR